MNYIPIVWQEGRGFFILFVKIQEMRIFAPQNGF